MHNFIKWEDRYKQELVPVPLKYACSGFECPKCKKEIYKEVGVVLASLPPKHIYKCLNTDCDFVGTF